MGLSIGHGIGIPFKKSGISWQIPTGLTVNVISEIQNNISWTNTDPSANGVAIERTSVIGGASGFVEIARVGIATTSIKDNVLFADTTYYYRIRLYKGSKYSAYSNVASGKTLTPAILSETATKILVDFTLASSVTKDASNRVSQVNDLSGLNHHFLQAGADNIKPVWDSEGLLFDGIRQFIKTGAFAFAQPEMIYLVFKQISWTYNDFIFDGNSDGLTILTQQATSNGLKAYAGTAQAVQDNGLALDTYGIVRIYFNGANSTVQVNGNTVWQGNLGTNGSAGITLGSIGSGTANFANIKVKGLIGRIRTEVKDRETIIYNSLIARYGLSVTKEHDYVHDYGNLKFGAFLCFSLSTFYGNDAGYVNGNINIFNPTDLDIDEWLDTFVTSGMKYATICAKTEDGFCLWPTAWHDTGYSPYSIAETTWYAANGSINILNTYLAGCRSRGLKTVVYFSLRDLTHEARSGTDEVSGTAAYIAMIEAQLSEILTNYGSIDAIWIDDWNWHISYVNIPFRTIHDYIKAIQPNCLVICNDHIYTASSIVSAVLVYEPQVTGYIPEGNSIIAEEVQTIRLDGVWSYNEALNQTASVLLTKHQILSKIKTANEKNGNYLLGISPDKTGHLTSAQKTILESLQV